MKNIQNLYGIGIKTTAIGSVLALVGVLILSSVYSPTDSVFRLASERNNARQSDVAKLELQAIAVSKVMDACIHGTDGGLSTIAHSPLAVSSSMIGHLTRYSTKHEINGAVDNAETICSDRLIQKLSVANPDAGGAIIYLLKEQNFKMDPKYFRYARQDNVALASVSF